ncbi:MAG TPA: class I SAM-dependent methyltransferase [Bacteroidota bacterium]|nr:class I SAM-dependent methyltransferase [Bacteroidota bacterium]
MTDASLPAGYDLLARQEADFWGSVKPDPENPQLWDDPLLFDLFLRPGWEILISQAEAAGSRVIDLACGEGNLSLALAERGMSVRGYDISAARISRAREKAAARSCTITPEFIVADLNTAELPPASADVVVAHDALHHLLALDHVVGQIHSALVPGGRLIVYDYIGMKPIRKFLALLFYAILPTYKPYRAKTGLYRRLGWYFATEKRRRKRMEKAGKERKPGGDSPFEEISGRSILPAIELRFRVELMTEYHGFFYYLAPKLRLPARWRTKILRYFALWDRHLVEDGICRGAYFYLIARKESA